jgi:hypothetical protein
MATWLDASFSAPSRLELATGHHLRQIREDDVDLDYVAVMGSQERLWEIFGAAWGWPPVTMTKQQDRNDLRRHAEEMVRNESFNYAVFDADESVLLGCVYVDPPERVGADADISWWVVDEEVDGSLDRALAAAVPAWIATAWPFDEPRFIGIDLTWQEWLALPELA